MFNVSDFIGNFQSHALYAIPRAGDLVAKAKFYRSISPETYKFARKFPLASYFVYMMAITIPDMFLSVALGTPFIKLVCTVDRFLLATIVWFLTFFSPQDFFYRIIDGVVGNVLLGVLVEINRKNVFTRVVERTLKMSARSHFPAVLITLFYVTAFMLAIFPLDQLMRGMSIVQHEAKAPHFGTNVGFMYAMFSLITLYGQDSGLPLPSSFKMVSLDTVHTAVMVAAIFLSVFHNMTGWDPMTEAATITHRVLSPKTPPIIYRRDPVNHSIKDQDSGEDDVVPVESPKRGRGAPARKRRSSKPNL